MRAATAVCLFESSPGQARQTKHSAALCSPSASFQRPLRTQQWAEESARRGQGTSLEPYPVNHLNWPCSPLSLSLSLFPLLPPPPLVDSLSAFSPSEPGDVLAQQQFTQPKDLRSTANRKCMRPPAEVPWVVAPIPFHSILSCGSGFARSRERLHLSKAAARPAVSASAPTKLTESPRLELAGSRHARRKLQSCCLSAEQVAPVRTNLVLSPPYSISSIRSKSF